MSSPSAADVWIGLGLGITFVYLIGAASLIATAPPRSSEARRFSRPELVLCAAILAVAAWLRFGHVETLLGGGIFVDEAENTRTYVSSAVHFEPVDYGATNLTHAWLLDTWYRFFGISTYSPRYYTAVVSLLGVLSFFAALRLAFNDRVAAWATAFLAVSTYAVYFSVIALSTSGVMLFVPLSAFLVVLWRRHPTLLRSCAVGLSVGLGLFTYPALVVGYAALVAAWVMCWTVERMRTRTQKGDGSPATVPRGRWIAVIATFSVVVMAGAILHHRVYFKWSALFRAGGGLDLSWAGLREAIPVVLGDLFVETRSWALLFRKTPFVDWTYWPFALLGMYCLWWGRRPRWVGRGIVLSIVITVLLVPLCGAYPGMRRGLYVLFPVCALAGLGADELYARSGRWLGTAVLLVALAHPIYYQVTFGRQQWKSAVFAQSFGPAPIPDRAFLDALEEHDVLMSTEEFAHPWDRLRYLHYWKLARRHGALHNRRHTLAFVSEKEPGRIVAAAERPETAFLTWAPDRLLATVIKPAGLCFRLEDLDRRPALVRLTSPSHATKDDVCPWPGGTEAPLGSCVELGWRHRLSRILHGVECDNAYCDASRPEFVFVEPGSVSFRLKAPPSRRPAVRLVLKVAELPPFGRENRVYVNGHDIGRLDRSRLESGGRLRVEVPPSAQIEGEAWSVRLGPGEGTGLIGWDVMWAALVAAPGGRRAQDDECRTP